MKRKFSGFTLIELLIVVAIIAILAAIAVPNLLEAQTRSKVSRVKADMRSIATGIEAFAVDNNEPPQLLRVLPSLGLTKPLEQIGNDLTTPIAYMTKVPYEPFNSRQGWILYEGWDVVDAGGPPINKSVRNCLYLYVALPSYELSQYFLPTALGLIPPGLMSPIPTNDEALQVARRGWYIVSPGPDTFFLFDQIRSESGEASPYIRSILSEVVACSMPRANGVYDPTNGTVSRGEIVRSGEGVFNTR